jgi:hypothetical protein
MDEGVVGTRGQVNSYAALPLAGHQDAPDVLRVLTPFTSRCVDRSKPNLDCFERPATGSATLGVMPDPTYNLDTVPLKKLSSTGVPS